MTENLKLDVSHSRCRCPACGKYFWSAAGFDKHRTGQFDGSRRCRTEDEMLTAGMVTNSRGYWVTAASDPGYWAALRNESPIEFDLDDLI